MYVLVLLEFVREFVIEYFGRRVGVGVEVLFLVYRNLKEVVDLRF